ncbi:hypothetical protein [Paracoccus tibetensis]|uniref:AAA+ family ATPase n=1 Tax=Paracoccus tibetensis TaxID=336292 RepID=A0A1G5H4Q1_9RHOB|nr:hypothetical protein [Paracoccus tibetensis]SCY58862.1 hypothetical protein SAMN05660710_01990 [Paracoccus tibetensis]
MTHRIPTLALLAALALPLPLPLAAQEPSAPAPEAEDGLSLIERGMGLLFRQFREEAAPQLDLLGRDMAGALERMAPALQELAALVDDIRNYEPPERLANGDILIRRRAEAPPPPPLGEGLQRLLPEAGPALPGRPAPLRDPSQPELDI